MGCIYSNREGMCSMWDEEDNGGSTYEDCEGGWDIGGYCAVEDDEDPGYSCCYFESNDPEDDE